MTKLSEGKTPGDFLLFETQNYYCRERATIGTAADLEPGAVLGKITATGKYILSVQTATDGSQTPAAVLMSEAKAAAADVEATILKRGPAQVRRQGLTFDATWSSEALRDTACAALEDKGIVALA
ncbi:hypothetical protein FIU97_14650 [Roseivivax sp. THAF40]|uniref:head decoration protein n=1 Tax=Roseivivax sp. THAF40 TaxID=2587858 RepID=UPI001267FEC6|nr:head decoration protein [Roseivivax sp. THAF40]QFT47819.1 hypothetical protein FIU97_14650 [Roseivivax sp. THAF40]